MTPSDFDKLGDRCKELEQKYAGQKLEPDDIVMIRLDGKSFHTFTKGLKRPYDERLSNCMVETTNYLVKQLNAKLGYTQSDEISLVFFNTHEYQQSNFNNKIQKLTSVSAAMATAKFNDLKSKTITEKIDNLAVFDSRVWSVPSMKEVVDTFVWRQEDAIKNAISMAAHAYFSNTLLLKKNSKEKKDMLKEKGIDFDSYPDFFKMGTFSYTKTKKVLLSDLPDEIKSKLKDSDLQKEYCLRNFIENNSIGRLKTMDNIKDVLFNHINENYNLEKAYMNENKAKHKIK